MHTGSKKNTCTPWPALTTPRSTKAAPLERLALKQDDLLLIYGASELMLLDTKYQANRFFSEYPTGFMIFNAATKGGSALTIAQKLAALGPDLRGRRIVLSVGPAIMTMAPDGDVNTRHYYGNFSQLHAMELAYSPYLSFDTKRRVACAHARLSRVLPGPPVPGNSP